MTANRLTWLTPLGSVNWGRLAFGAGSQLRVPPAHQAGLLDRGPRIRRGAHSIPVQDVLPQSLVPSSGGRGQPGIGEPLRRRVSEGEEGRLRVAGIPRPPADLEQLGVRS